MKVAVVDPDRATYDAIAGELEAVRWFTDAEAFLADCGGAELDAIVADAHLPGVDGVGLIHRLRAAGCAAPVVIVCARADVSTAVRAIRHGAADFFEKPIDGPMLAGRLLRLRGEGVAGSRKSCIV